MKRVDPQEFIYDLLIEHNSGDVRQFEGEIRCKCPFHGGKNRNSFRVKFDKDEPFFNCFSCHEHGSLAELVSYLTGKSLRSANKLVKRRTSIDSCTIQTLINRLEKHKTEVNASKQDVELPPKADNQEPMYEYLKKRRKRHHKVLRIQYIINKYGLYYCCEGRMAGRIIMPFYIDGELISYNDRTIIKGAKAKSLHPINSHFEQYVYGLQQAIGKPVCIIVEGAFDVYQVVCALSVNRELSQKYGVVGLMNAQATEDKLLHIVQNFDEAVIWMDHDDSGIDGAKKAYFFLKEYMKVKDVTREVPRDKDPGKCSMMLIKKTINKSGYQTESFLDRLRAKI